MKDEDIQLITIGSDLYNNDYDSDERPIPEEFEDDTNEEARLKYGI